MNDLEADILDRAADEMMIRGKMDGFLIESTTNENCQKKMNNFHV